MQTTDDFLDGALVALKDGKVDKAESMCFTVLEQNQHPYALHILGLVRHRQQRSVEGIQLLEKAQQIGGEHPDNYLDRAKMLLTLVEDDPIAAPHGLSQAEALFRRAIEMNPSTPQLRSEFAEMMNKMGRSEEAMDLLRPMLAQHPVPAKILISYAHLAPKLSEESAAISIIEAALENRTFSTAAEAGLLLALGGLFDKKGEYDRAFTAIQRSHDLKYSDVQAPNFAAYVDSIMETFESGSKSSLPRAAVNSDLPVYIIGLPRSGTSLVEQILASHSQVFGGGELKLMDNLVASLPTLASGFDYPKALRHLDSSTLDKIGREQLDYLESLGSGAKRVTSKQPKNFIYLGLISMIHPNARIIHCRRNILDTCVSMLFQSFDLPAYYIRTFESLAQYCLGYERLMLHWREVLDIRIFDVDYEDLVVQPEPIVKSILEFLGLPWEEACLQFHQSNRFVHTSSHDQVRRPIYDRAINRWQNYENQLGPLRKLLGI